MTEDNLNTRDPSGHSLSGQGPFEAERFGTLWLVWSDVGLVSLTLPDRPRPFSDREVPGLCDIPEKYAKPLRDYFAGEAIDPTSIDVDMRGTRFQKRVWSALRAIPRGQVRSYAGIAADVGSPRAMRAVGMANSKNPIAIVVPCHRVVEKGNRLGGYTGGLDKKIFLLELEGVRVEGDVVLPGQLDLTL